MLREELRSWHLSDALFLVLGVAYWGYVNLMYAFPSHMLADAMVPDNVVTATLVGNVLSLAFLFLLPDRNGRDILSRPTLVSLSCVSALLGAFMLLLAGRGFLDVRLVWLAGVFGGFGQGFLLVLLACVFVRLPFYKILLFTGAQQLLSVPIFILIERCADLVIFVSILALIAAEYAAVFALMSTVDSTQRRPFRHEGRREGRGMMAGVACMALFIGACYGFATGLTAEHSAMSLSPFNTLGMILGGALLMLSAALFRRDHLVGERFYQILVPLLALGLASVPLLSNGLSLALPILIAVGSYFFGMLWFLVAFACSKVNVSVVRMASLSFLCCEVGHMIVRGLSSLVSLSLETAGTISIIMLVVIIVALVVLLPRQGRYEAVLSSESKALLLEVAAERLARREGLTTREHDVLTRIIKGDAVRAIAQDLSLSEATVNTHVQHIYQKTGIHSRDELLALLRGEASSIDLADGL